MYDGPVRKRLRYPGHDYRAPCCVHVTICTHNRQPLFGTISDIGVHLNDAGRFTANALRSLHSEAEGIAVDTFIVMPDHVHAIIMLGTNPRALTTASIPDIVQRFKMRVVKSWPVGIRTQGWSPYDTHLWHRSYNDTLIDNDAHLQRTREYILGNPARWLER
jgi:putative transposase